MLKVRDTERSNLDTNFFSLNMSAPPRKYGPLQKLLPTPLGGSNGLKLIRYCLHSQAIVSFARAIVSFAVFIVSLRKGKTAREKETITRELWEGRRTP